MINAPVKVMSSITTTTTTESLGKLVFSVMSSCKGYGAEVRRYKAADSVWGTLIIPAHQKRYLQWRYRVVLCDYSEAQPHGVVLMEMLHKISAARVCKRIMSGRMPMPVSN